MSEIEIVLTKIESMKELCQAEFKHIHEEFGDIKKWMNGKNEDDEEQNTRLTKLEERDKARSTREKVLFGSVISLALRVFYKLIGN
jgi:hypothetical protein